MRYLLISDNKSLINKFGDELSELVVLKKLPALTIVEKIQSDNDFQVIVFDAEKQHEDNQELIRLILSQKNPRAVFFLIADSVQPFKTLVKEGVNDIFTPDLKIADLVKRAEFITTQQSKPKYEHPNNYQWKGLPVWKRTMDIVLSLTAIILLSPIFLLVALAIRLESKGKVFYAAKRVGTGFKIFPFYKFRSMYMDADKRVDALMAQNQYGGKQKNEETEQAEALGISNENDTMLMHEDDFLPETQFLKQKKDKEENAFFKMANDPRITKVGKFIRNTSIDELPQLFNILKGDMSVVGNRPLPLYEAELLTNNEWSQRFLAPAGLTGLWQVTTRGKGKKLSADERKQLDIDYANNYNFRGDVMIILKTIPALLQEENV
jgi:lipopolysaccharide/colanic/teichoic acid biosynthesis glycosyltransferase